MQLKQDITEHGNKPKCIIYARVSTMDQVDNLSIETQQIKALEKIQELGGYLAEDCYIDSGISGTTLNRPSFQSLLKRCSKKDIAYLVVQDISRLSRDTFEYCFIISELEKCGVKVVPLSGVINGDPVSRTMNEMMAVMNSFFPRMTSYKVKQTAAEKFKAGYYPSWAPLGYLNVVNKNPEGSYDKKIVIPDPITSPFVRQAFKLYATRDYAIYDIRQYLHKNGVTGKKGRPIQYSTVGNMLKSPFYWGWMKHGGLEGMGKYEPLVDKPTFDLVQRILSEKGDYGLRKRKHNFLLRGIIFCKDCGRRYVAEWHYNQKYITGKGKIGMYHCSQTGKRGGCPSRYVLLTDLEDQVRQEVDKLAFTDEFIKAVETTITRVYDESVDLIQHAKKALYNKRDAVDQKRKTIEKDYFENKLSAEQLQKFNDQLDVEALIIQKELVSQNKVNTIDTAVINEVLKLTRNIIQTYEDSDIDHKRAYLHFFFQKIWVQDKKIVEVEYTPVIQVLNEVKLGILSTFRLPALDSIRNAVCGINIAK